MRACVIPRRRLRALTSSQTVIHIRQAEAVAFLLAWSVSLCDVCEYTYTKGMRCVSRSGAQSGRRNLYESKAYHRHSPSPPSSSSSAARIRFTRFTPLLWSACPRDRRAIRGVPLIFLFSVTNCVSWLVAVCMLAVVTHIRAPLCVAARCERACDYVYVFLYTIYSRLSVEFLSSANGFTGRSPARIIRAMSVCVHVS